MFVSSEAKSAKKEFPPAFAWSPFYWSAKSESKFPTVSNKSDSAFAPAGTTGAVTLSPGRIVF